MVKTPNKIQLSVKAEVITMQLILRIFRSQYEGQPGMGSYCVVSEISKLEMPLYEDKSQQYSSGREKQ